MAIHIGQKIKEVFYQQRISVKEFAYNISRSRNVIYNIFGRDTIDTGLLLKISKVLKHNFFQYYLDYVENDEIMQEGTIPYKTKDKMLQELITLKDDLKKRDTELEHVKKENEYLKKINTLLESNEN